MGGVVCKVYEGDGFELGIYRKWLKEEEVKILDLGYGSWELCVVF